MIIRPAKGQRLTPQEAFLNEWLQGTTCHRSNRLLIHWQSDDGRFVILKHKGHSEYTSRWGLNKVWCGTYYALYDITAPQPGLFGEPSLLKVTGQWTKKHQAEAEKIIAAQPEATELEVVTVHERYEWDCPVCDFTNDEGDISPAGDVVHCSDCKGKFKAK